MHEGNVTDDEFLPHFSCKVVSDTILEIMRTHPDKHLTILCGHTHSPAQEMILPNLEVRAGSAVYREPEVQAILKIS